MGCSMIIIFMIIIIISMKTKSLFTPLKLDSIKWLRFGFCANNSGFDKYLFQLIALLKPDFNC